MYVRERAKMFSRIREECDLEHAESMDAEWQMNVLTEVEWRRQEER